MRLGSARSHRPADCQLELDVFITWRSSGPEIACRDLLDSAKQACAHDAALRHKGGFNGGRSVRTPRTPLNP